MTGDLGKPWWRTTWFLVPFAMFYPLLPMYALTRAHSFSCSIGRPDGPALWLFWPLFVLICWGPALVGVWMLPYQRSMRIWQLAVYILAIIPLSYASY
ncbi:MAG TPA: hypothetical protein VEF76_12955, partial [Patescibacteria group bacterium]|nr:hypothetical protein [Patescibacteria group bacterium]